MVVFTCQHCNEALKKPAVEKHYNIKCRRKPYLTCVDCLQDFCGEEYVEHTSCVSEDQRYGDKNFVPKPVAVKQNNWIEVVQNYMKNNKNPKYFSIFQRLKSVPNLPRKKPKFINFMSNAMNMRNADLAGEVFDLFQEEFERGNSHRKENKSKGNEAQENEFNQKSQDDDTSNNSVDKKRSHISESDAHDESHVNGSFDSNLKGKKKKSKKHKEKHKQSLEVVNKVDNNGKQNGEICNNKKLKGIEDEINVSQSAQELNISQEAEEPQNPVPEQKIEDVEKLSKKELKKLKKKQKFESELKQIEDENFSDTILENVSEEVNVEKKSKKKKRKANISESESDNFKKQKVEEAAPVEPLNGSLQVEEEPSHKGKFHWDEVVKEILKNNSDHEMSVKRLSKKVLAEYQAVKGNRESYEELISKFNKKINKIPGVKVLKDKARLITGE